MAVGYIVNLGLEGEDQRDWFSTVAISDLAYYYGQKKTQPRPISNQIEAYHELSLIKRHSQFSALLPDAPGAGHVIHQLLKSKAENKKLGMNIRLYPSTDPNGTSGG